MKYTTASRISIGLLLFNFGITSLSAQEIDPQTNAKTEVVATNKWSFELGLGSNIAVRPFGTGYNSERSFSSLNHFDFGFRYMINPKFGLKSDLAFDGVSNKLEKNSLPFRTLQYRIGLQGVFNLGKAFEFETFSNTIGLLGHGGFQLSKLKSKFGNGIQESVADINSGFVLGLTPQIKLSERTALTIDFSMISNLGQNLNWDGSESAKENNLSGLMYTTSIGLTIYLGKNKKPLDLVNPKKGVETSLDATLSSTEKNTSNSTAKKEGQEAPLNAQNTATSTSNSELKGDNINFNNKGNLEAVSQSKTIEENTNSANKQFGQLDDNDFKSMLKNGFVNIFYDVNQDEPNSGSTNYVFNIIALLRQNPSINVMLVGYSDKTGSAAGNQKLSESRAKKLYELFVFSGILESRLKKVGRGVDRSITANSKIAFQLARRVSVVLN